MFSCFYYFKVGDRVVALPEFRAWSELVTCPIKYVYPIPEEMTFQDAAATVMNYLVAYILLFDLISLRPGKSILLHSVGGGVVSNFFKSYFHIKLFIIIIFHVVRDILLLFWIFEHYVVSFKF